MSRLKAVSLLLVSVMLLSLVGCGPAQQPTEAPTEVVTEPTATEEEVAEPTATEEDAAEPTATEEEVAEPTEPQVTQTDLVFGMAVHQDPAAAHFWGIVEKGARDAAATYGVELKSGGSPDPAEQAQLIEDYVSEGLDGIFVSLANPDAVEDSVQKVVDAGIPLITMNSGVDVYKEFGAMTHVGQTEFVAGQGAGERFNEMGLEKALCVIHEEGNIALEERCDGLEDTFNGEVERFNVATTGIADPAGTLASIQDKLISDETFDSMLTLNPTIGVSALDAIDAAGRDIALATFDLSPDVLEAVNSGEMAFAIDQQQYLQGYLPVVFLYLYNMNLNTVGGGRPVLTGPGFVTQENASEVMDLAEQGTR